ncbi:MAG: lipid II flippase MurJ [Chloroflexota bacterium]
MSHVPEDLVAVSVDELPRDDESEPALLHHAARATAVLAAAGVIGQVVTLARELFVAYQVGISPDLDALLVAAVPPIMFASLLSSGTAAAIVPAYLSTESAMGRRAADRLLGATLTWTLIVGIGLAAMTVMGSALFVTIAGPGLDETSKAQAVAFAPTLAPMLVFSAIAAVMAAAFQIHDRMRSIAIAWVIGPVASAIVTVVFWKQLGLTALAIGMTVQQAAVAVTLVLLAIRARIQPPFTARADRTQAARFLKHATPLTVSSSVLQLNLLTDRAVASVLAPGAVSALRYAEGVIRIPLNAVLPAWSAAIYPALTRASLIGHGSMGRAAEGALRYVTVIFLPLSVATIALAPLIVEVAYGRGAFDAEAASLTSAALAGFAPLLLFSMLDSVLSGAHNARRRGMFLMWMGFANAAMNAVFNVVLGRAIGVAGIALSTSLTVGFIQVIKARRLHTLDDTPLRGLANVTSRSLLVSTVVGIPLAVIARSVPSGLGIAAFGLLCILTLVGLAGYVILGRLVGLTEPLIVVQLLIRAPMSLIGRMR